jgi:hypothetical protein
VQYANVQHTNVELTHRLSPAHLEMLRRGSGISDEVIAARGYRTIIDRADLPALGFKPAQCRVPGLLLPMWPPDADHPALVLRDMADYGATLAFDDAEHLSDPARTDPDKRALLLRHPDGSAGGARAAQDALAIREDEERQGLGRQRGRTAPLDPRLRGRMARGIERNPRSTSPWKRHKCHWRH